MIIRKLFKFENAHIVRNCSTKKCKYNIHGHSYRCEILIESNFLDKAEMVYDFGLIKFHIKEFIDSFDHSISLWNKDNKDYIKFAKKFSDRWIVLPVNPTAEQLSRIIFIIIDKLLQYTDMINGEKMVKLYSIIIHETDTGYAQCFKNDAYNKDMGLISMKDIKFSKAIRDDWRDKKMFKKLIENKKFSNPKEI